MQKCPSRFLACGWVSRLQELCGSIQGWNSGPSGETMLWRGGRQSTNVEDRRGMRLGTGLVGGGLGTVVLLLVLMFLGVDPRGLIDTGEYDSVDTGAPIESSPADQETKEFVSTVLGFTEDAWTDIFASSGRVYRAPKLVLYTRAVQSACGLGQAAMGPFYCPPDEKVYLD